MDTDGLDVRSRVATAILASGKISQALIEVEEQDGCVTLRGNTTTEQDRVLTEYIASSQNGVVKVINKIVCG